jgi:glutathione-regulated potassium-efflux system ancillary protein KefF
MATPNSSPSKPASAEPPEGADVLVIVAHPQMEHSRINRRLMHAAKKRQRQDGAPSLLVRDLYHLYPDYLIDVAAEQALVAKASLVVWQHPIHWYSMPPLMKLWLDDVLSFGWAYGPGGTALQGKDLWLVASTGGPDDSYRPDSYNRYFFEAFLPPYEQTAALCGMRFLPPLMLHGAHKASDQELAEHERIYIERLASHPHWPEIEELDERIKCDVPLSARPAEVESEGAA